MVEETKMLRKSWTLRPAWLRTATAFAVLGVLLGTITTSGAHVSQATGFEDHFEYPSGTPLLQAPTGSNWVLDPPVPAGWIVEKRATSFNQQALGSMSVLAAKQKQGPPLDPIAFVKKSFGNFVAQTQAAFDGGVPNNSGIGIVFHAAMDPNTGIIDRNNLYLFTSINTTPNSKTFPTGHAFMLFKRNEGTYYMAAPPKHTYVDFSAGSLHTYKVGMSGQRIQAWVDGIQMFNIEDTSGPDPIAGGYSMPGAPIVLGAFGLRTSRTAALFDDVFVIGSPAYEARAAATSVYGKLGLETGFNTVAGGIPAGVEKMLSGGDSGWQYHDHDFSNTVSGPSLNGPSPVAAAVLGTSGADGTTTSGAQVAGIAGMFSDPDMKTFVSISADVLKAVATASCTGTNSKVDVVNFTYQVLSFQTTQSDPAHPTEEPSVQQGSITRLNAPPETNVLDPNSTGPSSPVKITLHSRKVSTDPQRVEAAAIRITFLASPSSTGTPGNIEADVAIAHSIAGRLCEAL
jgi:hypothetical protein